MKLNTLLLKSAAMSLLMLCGMAGMPRCEAVPAFPGLIKAVQKDGTTLSIRRIGDERCHITVTADGYPLLFSATTGNYEYALPQGSGLVSSGVKASNATMRSVAEKQLLAQVDREAVMAQFNKDFATANAAQGNSGKGPKRIVRISDVPTTGKHDVAIILVNFSDLSFNMSDPVAYYNRFFNQRGFSDNGATGSAYDYYRYGSNNSYDPQFKVIGPVTVSYSHSFYGGSDGTAYAWQMVSQAVQLADSLYDVDFKQFDTDGDGVCDNVYCVYAGYGRADSKDNSAIWPHSGNLSASGSRMNEDHSFSVDGVKIDRYTVSQEINGETDQTCGIGTFVHEFAHVLGLADHYNNSNTGATNQPGYWDVMANGSYSNHQNTPPTFSAFERYSLGWQSLVELQPKTDTMVVAAPYEDGGSAYRVSVPGRSNEYFVIENRQQKGWDQYLPGHGLLVWHIDEDQSTWRRNMANYTTSHQHVDIVEADGYGSRLGKDSDVFPGTKNVTSFTFPSWQDGDIFGFGWLRENADSTAQFLLSGSGYRLNQPTLGVDSIMGTSARLSWTPVDLATDYDIAVCLGDSTVYTMSATDGGTATVSGLLPETTYRAVALARLSEYRSDSVVAEFTTLPLQIEEKKVEALDATGITADGFTAHWSPLAEADRYRIVLYSCKHDGVGEYGTGFDGYSSTTPVLPDGWTDPSNHSSNRLHYATDAPSMRINVDSTSLTVSKPGDKLQGIRFWHYASNATASLVVEAATDGAWTELKRYTYNNATDAQPDLYPHGGRADTLALDNADSVRFTLVRAQGQGGYVLLDDVYATYLFDTYTPVDTVYATADSCVFSGLVAGGDYAYSVTAFMGNRVSLPSDSIRLTTMSEPTGISTISNRKQTISSSVYDTRGVRVGTYTNGRLSATLPKGVYIIGGTKVTKR